VNVEGQVVGLAIQAMDEEQAARDGRRQVLAVGEEVAECGLDVGVDLTARVQIHGHVKVEHLGAHGCGGAFEVSRNLVVVLLLLKGDALRVEASSSFPRFRRLGLHMRLPQMLCPPGPSTRLDNKTFRQLQPIVPAACM